MLKVLSWEGNFFFPQIIPPKQSLKYYSKKHSKHTMVWFLGCRLALDYVYQLLRCIYFLQLNMPCSICMAIMSIETILIN